MDSSTFTFEPADKDAPDVVIRRFLPQIEEATHGYVIGNIERYTGYIRNYTKTVRNNFMTTFDSLQSTPGTVQVDIQDELGELGSEKNRFEVFLTARELQNYKYRMFFVEYSSVAYPVTIVMNEALAADYLRNQTYIYKIPHMIDLEDMLNKVLDSPTMIVLLQNLINESLRREASIDIS